MARATSSTSSPRVQGRWENTGTTAAPRAVLTRTIRGEPRERQVGPRAKLALDEAAALLNCPVSYVRCAIRTKFLRAARDRGHVVVTLAACRRFLDEEREDGEAAVAARAGRRRTGAARISSDQVFRELGLE